MNTESTPVQDTPLLSVITICKDHPAGFLQTMNSVRWQFDHADPKTIEWIVVNGSTESDDIARMIEANKDMVTWSQSQADKGIYHAMNIGIDQSRGKYMQFMNAGDTFANPWTVAQMKDALEENPDCDFLYGRYYSGDRLRPARPLEKSALFMPSVHQAMVFRTDLVGDMRYNTQYKISADYEFILRFLKKCDTTICAHYPIARFEEGGVSGTRYRRAAREAFDIRRDIAQLDPLMNYQMMAVSIVSGILRHSVPDLYPFLRHMYDLVVPSVNNTSDTENDAAPYEVKKWASGPKRAFPENA